MSEPQNQEDMVWQQLLAATDEQEELGTLRSLAEVTRHLETQAAALRSQAARDLTFPLGLALKTRS